MGYGGMVTQGFRGKKFQGRETIHLSAEDKTDIETQWQEACHEDGEREHFLGALYLGRYPSQICPNQSSDQ